jgi:hypothetical protein
MVEVVCCQCAQCVPPEVDPEAGEQASLDIVFVAKNVNEIEECLNPEKGPMEKAHLLLNARSTVSNAKGQKLLIGRQPVYVFGNEHPLAKAVANLAERGKKRPS